MHIVYNGLDINLTAPVVIAIIGFVEWIIKRHDKRKSVHKAPSDKA